MSQLIPTHSRLDLRPFAGRLIIATAILHLIVGTIYYAGALRAMVEAGLINTVSTTERDAAFWFMFGGVALLLIGGLAHWAQQQTGTLPAGFGWGLIALSIGGVLIMPVSGFWLVFGLGALILAVAHRSSQLKKSGILPDR